MLTQQVISQQVSIARKGSIKHFQLRLPRHAQKVIALECGMRMISNLPAQALPADLLSSLQFIPSRVIGELRLQHIGKAGLFFSTQVMEQDAHLCFGDFSTRPGFAPLSWTHSGKREPVTVQVEREAPLLLGLYKDIIGENLNQHLAYTIMIHLWFETNEETYDN